MPGPDGDQLVEVERLLSLGARRADIGQGDVPWVVMEDPDGHELCVLRVRDAEVLAMHRPSDAGE